VLGGADFGAGLWHTLLRGDDRAAARDHTYHAMGPVWEANHVWLIFVLVVTWTAYPHVFGDIFSTLYVPLFVAAIGIIMRGTAYAMRSSAIGTRAEATVSAIFGVSSLLTPFALGLVIGGIASGRVPGDSVDSWWNGTSIVVGVLAVATSAYVAAVWLTADAARASEDSLVALFRRLAIGAGAVAGVLAVVGVVVLHSDDRPIFDGLTSGLGLVCVLGSVAAGVATPLLLVRGRFELARYSAAVAVGAVVTGWAVAQSPDLLPGVSVDDAAASNATIVALLIATAVGALVLIPSLSLLFGLVLHGRFDEGAASAPETSAPAAGVAPAAWVLRAAIGCAVVGLPLMLAFDSGVGLGAGVVLLLAAAVLACAALVPAAVAADE
jgi:cytochrome d ubiquinol oxidase subunit II